MGGLDYLLLTDTEFTDDDFSENSAMDSCDDSESGIEFTPIPDLEMESMTPQQLAAQLADVRNQFRHLKVQFGKVLSQKQELQSIIDTRDATIKQLEATISISPIPVVERKSRAERKGRRGTSSLSRRGSSKKVEREKVLISKFQLYIPCASESQKKYQLKYFPELDVVGDEAFADELTKSSFKALLSLGCFVDTIGGSNFINDMTIAIQTGFCVSITKKFYTI